MTANELNLKAVEAYKKGQAVIATADPENKGVIPADKVAEANAFFDEADGWKKQADFTKRADDAKTIVADLSKAPIRKHPMAHEDTLIELRQEQRKTALTMTDGRFKAMDPRILAAVNPETKAPFEAFMRFGLESLQPDERKALSTLTDAEGGFVVTEEFRTEIIRKLRNLVYFRQYARVIPTSAGAVAFPTFDPADSQTASPVTQQNAAITQLNLSQVFGKTQFVPHKRASIVPMPLELLEDAVVDVANILTDFLAMRIAELQENDFISGTGVNQPLGLVTAIAKIASQNFNIAGSTTAMVPEDIVKGVYAMRAVYRNSLGGLGSLGGGAMFLMHRLVVQAVRLFRTNIGGAGTGTFMFQPSMQAGQPPALFGYPLLESEFMPNPYTGSAGTPMFLFANLAYYWIVDRTDIMLQRLNELYAANDQVGFRLRVRTDGAPVLADPFVLMNRQ